jgi:hypothetical protein
MAAYRRTLDFLGAMNLVLSAASRGLQGEANQCKKSVARLTACSPDMAENCPGIPWQPFLPARTSRAIGLSIDEKFSAERESLEHKLLR